MSPVLNLLDSFLRKLKWKEKNYFNCLAETQLHYKKT